MPFAESRGQVPAPMLAEYDAAVACFNALSVADRLMLRRLWVLGPLKLDNDYYLRLAHTDLVCRIATTNRFMMAATLMGGMLCKIYQDKFQEDLSDVSAFRL